MKPIIMWILIKMKLSLGNADKNTMLSTKSKGWIVMKELWDKYYSEYIQKHKSDGKDVFQLTNEAISYCMEKLGLKTIAEIR